MYKYGAIIAFLLLIARVLSRAVMLKKEGIQAMVFARTHKSDWVLPPIVFFFVYHLFANAFDWPRISGPNLVDWPWLGWTGCIICALGIALFYWGVYSFGKSFRVGIDDEKPGGLVTTGAFAHTRNPLYVAFGLEVTGFSASFPILCSSLSCAQDSGCSAARLSERKSL